MNRAPWPLVRCPPLCAMLLWFALAAAAAPAVAGPGTGSGVLAPVGIGVQAADGGADAAQPGASAPAGDPGRQLLVMVRLPPPHFRADRDYGGGWRSGRAVRQRTAEAIAHELHLSILSGWPMADLGVECFVMETADATVPAASVASQLAADPRVESVEVMQTYRTLGHNDPLLGAQPADALWHLSDLHRATTGKGVRVAVIDSGVDLMHPDLRGQVEKSGNLVDGGAQPAEVHGTAVAGIIAARADDGIGIAGIAPSARLLALRACWEIRSDTGQAQCNSFTLAKALQAALDMNADVINMSLSGPDDRLLGRLVDVALRRGVTVVGASAAAGAGSGFPASHPGVLAAAAIDEARSGDFPVPGRDIPATLPGGRWGLVSGSSFAAAHLSGLVALIDELEQQHRALPWPASRLPVALHGAESGSPAALDACQLARQVAHRCICNCESHLQAMH